LFEGEEQKGTANILVIGDSTTGKSKTVRTAMNLLDSGLYITAETASMVGLTGAAVHGEKMEWFVDWGFLVLADGKLLNVDGVQKLSKADWASIAEAERTGIVTISKAAKSEARARTRFIKIANPVEADRGRTKPMSSFLHGVLALSSVLDSVSIARLDVAVFSRSEDVSPEKVNQKLSSSCDPDLGLLSEALRFCWSSQGEVVFEDGAVNRILQESTRLSNKFSCQECPLVSIDMKFKIARLSSALAFLTLSTDDYEKVIVKEEHVRKVVEFIEDEYDRAGLDSLASIGRTDPISDEEMKTLRDELLQIIPEQKRALDIIGYMAIHPTFTKGELVSKFKLKDRSELRPLLALLLDERLIRLAKGFCPTQRLSEFYEYLNGSATLAPVATV
jgi:MCM P-loop domain